MDKKQQLDELKKKMKSDESLPLRKSAKNLVFGEGDADTELLFIGEGPGYWEDQKGRPFVGNAGALLNQLISSIKLPREDVFITNVIHYRPPENRDPNPEELAAFSPYLDRIIEIINPKVIVTLGRFSMAKFIPGAYISSVHGKLQRVTWKGKELVVVPMYHPAAALRSQEIKEKLKNDFLDLFEMMKSLKEGLKDDKIDKKVEQMKLV